MKRKLKITYGQLEATQERVAVFRNALENMDSAIEMFQNILSEQQSDAITALLEDGRDLRDEMELLHGNLQELENMLSGYIQDMTALVMPKSWDSMMLVDRNDIWVNMKQIKSNVSDTEQVIWGGALQHYKDVHTNIPKPHISSSMTEPEKRSAREEYDRKVRERAQREENYKKLKAFTETQAKQAKQELEECYKEIEDLYRNRIVVYENTDDEYKKTAMDLYQQCTSFGQRLKDLVTKTEEMKWDVRRGVLAAVLDLVKTALAIQDLKNTLDTLPFAVVAEVMGIEVPGLSLEKVDDLRNMAYGAVAALQDPPRVLAALGQKIGDTVEEEGIAYSISYVAADVAIQVLLSKGLGEVKNVSKADDLVDVARTVDTLDDTVKIADELTDAAKAVDQVGDITDAAMAVNVMDEANAVVKAVDNVTGVIESGTPSVIYGTDDIARYRYNMIENPGPLVDVVDNPAKNFYGGRYNVNILKEDTIFYRAGQAGKPLGQWFTTEAPESVAKVRIDTAVKPQWIDRATGELTGVSIVDTVYAIKVPKGTTVYTGPIGPQGGAYCGGYDKLQTFIQTPWKLDGIEVINSVPSVSYTHLTLPTILLV